MDFTKPATSAILSPCTGVCALGQDGYCQGCMRSLDEIARWSQMSAGERQRLMQTVLPQRESARG